MKKEFTKALEDMENLILDIHEKYHIEQDDLVRLGLLLNKIAMLSPQGTIEGTGQKNGRIEENKQRD